MANNLPKHQAPEPDNSLIEWLLDSDPAIRWQVLQDLTGAPADVVAVERAWVATEGWGHDFWLCRGPTGGGRWRYAIQA